MGVTLTFVGVILMSKVSLAILPASVLPVMVQYRRSLYSTYPQPYPPAKCLIILGKSELSTEIGVYYYQEWEYKYIITLLNNISYLFFSYYTKDWALSL